MLAVHDFGKEENCTMATVQTISFQNAEGFYQRLGYEVDYERSGYVDNSSCMFLKKVL